MLPMVAQSGFPTTNIVEMQTGPTNILVPLFPDNGKIQTLHNTVRLQLAAAEHLSECLSEQMAALNITSPAVKRHNVAKELLESIGIENQEYSFESPDVKRFGFSPDSAKNIPLSPSSTRQGFGRNTSTAFMSFEPETTRRRRDSLDRSWNNFEPQKTMVKRMSCQKTVKGNVDTGSSYKDSQILTGRTSQCKSFEDVGSLLMKSSVSKVLDHNYLARDNEEKPSKKMHDSQPGSMFDSVKVISKSSQVRPKSFEPHTEVTKSSKAYPSLSIQLSETTSGNNLTSGKNQTWTFGTNTLTDKLNLEVSSSKDPDILTSKVASVSSTVYSSRVQSSIIGRSSSEVTETVSPLCNPPIHVYDKTKPAILSSSTEFNTREKLEKVHPTSPMTVKMLGSQDMSSILLPDLPSSASLRSPPSSLASAATPFVSQGTQVKSLTTASTISFGGTSDVCKSNTNENVSIVTPQSPSSDPSLQPPISSSPFTFSSISRSSVFQPTPSSDVQSSSTSDVSPANEKTVSSAASTSAFAGVSSQVQSSLITSTTNIFSTPISSGEISSPTTNTEFRKKEDIPDISSHEDEMDEEAPEIPATHGLGSLENIGLGSAVTHSVPKPNPFGGSFITPANTVPSDGSTVSLAIPPGEVFKPPSFSFPPVRPMQSPPMINSTGVSSGFGKPAQFGMGQQALGSVLGTFGQTRQLGGTQGIAHFSGGFGGSPVPSASAGGFTAAAACGTSVSVGGFAAVASKSGGFAGASTGGGFASLARTGGGFASVAPTGGGFAGAGGGGFSALASGGGGLSSTASVGGGFAGAASGSGRPPAEVLMQMRK